MISQWWKNIALFIKPDQKNRDQLGGSWYLNEIFIKTNGVLHYLWLQFVVQQTMNENVQKYPMQTIKPSKACNCND